MDRLHTLRRLPMTIAAFALLALPIGCGSDAPTTAEVPTPPTVVVDAPTGPGTPAPSLGSTPGAVEPPGPLDQSVRQTATELKGEAHADAVDAKKEAREAEGDVKKAVGDAEDEAKRKAREIERDARKSAEEAMDRLLPSPK